MDALEERSRKYQRLVTGAAHRERGRPTRLDGFTGFVRELTTAAWRRHVAQRALVEDGFFAEKGE